MNGVSSNTYPGDSRGDFNIIKDFYVEDEKITNANPEHVKNFKDANQITVNPANPDDVIPNPCIEFEQAFKCDPQILRTIASQTKIVKPTPNQCQVIPILLKGLNCVYISQTGSGKTLAFLLPGFVHASRQTDPKLCNPRKPGILVLCPTRELAIQTHSEVLKFAYRGFNAVCVYGGAHKHGQISAIRSGCKVIVGTPGRVIDLIEQGVLDLSAVTYSVLDEADRMLDMGFEPQIRSILEKLPSDRQNVMTSATWPAEAQQLSAQYMNSPVRVNVGSMDLHAAETIQQIVETDFQNAYAKEDHLVKTMNSELSGSKVLIFTNTKRQAIDLCRRLKQSNVYCDTIHGNLDQNQRERALSNFRSNRVTVLTATDVAARGLDLPDIQYVINFDMPNNIDEYVHRIGRTGRAGCTAV